MAWEDVKAGLKAAVHGNFRVSTVYSRVDESGEDVLSSFASFARVNNDVRTVGSSPSGGLAQIVQDVPQMRIDPADMEDSLPPQQGDEIFVTSENTNYRILNIRPRDGIYYVVEVEPKGG